MDGQNNADNTSRDEVRGKKPSLRQQAALAVIEENRGKVISKAEVLRRAGFSKSTVENPDRVFGTETWEKLLKKHLPDTFLASKHRQLMSQQKLKKEYVPVDTSDDEITEMCNRLGMDLLRIGLTKDKKAKVLWLAEPNVDALRHGLNMAYDLKGKYAPKKVETTTTNLEMVLISIRDGRTSGSRSLAGGDGGASIADRGLQALRGELPVDQNQGGGVDSVPVQSASAGAGGATPETAAGDGQGTATNP